MVVSNAATATTSDALAGIQITKGSSTVTTAQRFMSFTTGAGTYGYLTANGSGAAPVLAASSDRRIKTNIATISNALSKISLLNPVTFNMVADGASNYGFIAQEYAQVFPDQVNQTDDGTGTTLPPGTEPWSMSDAHLIPYLTKSIQELNANLTALQTDYAAYKASHPMNYMIYKIRKY